MKDKIYAAHKRAARNLKPSPSQDAARHWWTRSGTTQAKQALGALLVNATPEQIRAAQQQNSDEARDQLAACSANDAPIHAKAWGKAQRILELLEIKLENES